MQIHQLVPALHEGDAIGDSSRKMRDYLRERGYGSDIYAYAVDDALVGEALRFGESFPAVSRNDLLILHYALPSGMSEFLRQADCRKALIYHNITPAYYWMPYQDSLVHLASEGRKELARLAPFVERSAGDSEYNRRELDSLGFRNTTVVPIYVDRDRYLAAPSPLVTKTMDDGAFQFLFVGRVAPNKKLEDILKLLFFFKKLYSPVARVVFVGKTDVEPSYTAGLREFSARLAILPDELLFAGHVDWPDLVAYYRSSTVFVSMSEHEGFCVPLVESMICDLPIVAYSAAAVPFTLGNAGILFGRKDYPEIAGFCHRIGADPAFRQSILDGQRERLKAFSRESVEASLEQFLEPLL
jgi:glycosyltransferase involved in cell wall biosynthesis